MRPPRHTRASGPGPPPRASAARDGRCVRAAGRPLLGTAGAYAPPGARHAEHPAWTPCVRTPTLHTPAPIPADNQSTDTRRKRPVSKPRRASARHGHPAHAAARPGPPPGVPSDRRTRSTPRGHSAGARLPCAPRPAPPPPRAGIRRTRAPGVRGDRRVRTPGGRELRIPRGCRSRGRGGADRHRERVRPRSHRARPVRASSLSCTPASSPTCTGASNIRPGPRCCCRAQP